MFAFSFGLLSIPVASGQMNCEFQIPPGLYEAFRTNMAEVQEMALQENSLPGAAKNIPVHFTSVQYTTESTNLNQGDINNALNILNGAFSGANFNFFQCGPVSNICRTEVDDNPDFINFLPLFSYNYGAVEVYVHKNGGWGNNALIPCRAYQSGNPNFPLNYCFEPPNLIRLGHGGELLNKTFIHEMGHYFGLFHTHNVGTIYQAPPQTNQLDYPYRPDPLPPLWWGRELVIRKEDDSKMFTQDNILSAGDLMPDTPCDCTENGFFKNNNVEACPVIAQTEDCETFTNLLTYKDYNNDPIYPAPGAPPSSGYTMGKLGRNYMSYWKQNCLNEFTQWQKLAMSIYYVNPRKDEFRNQACDWPMTGKVEYEGSSLPMRGVTIRVRHNGLTKEKCNSTSDLQGNFSGLLHANKMKSSVYHNGKKNTLASATDPLKAHFDHTRCEWLRGVNIKDVWVSQALLSNASGYQKLAADVNKDGVINFLDRMLIQRFILGPTAVGLATFPAFDQPWRFVPEFIPQDYAAEFHANPFSIEIGGTPVSSNTYTSFDFEYDRPDNSKVGFDAVKIGDIDSSWPSGSDESPCKDGLPPLGNDIPLFVNPNSMDQGDTVNLLIKANNFNQIAAFQIALKLSPDKFEILDAAPGSLEYYDQSAFGLALKEQGIVGTLWYNKDSISANSSTLLNGSKLFSIKAKVKQQVNDLPALISIDNDFFPSQIFPLVYSAITPPSLEIDIENLSARGHKSKQIKGTPFKCYPNPVGDNFQLVFDTQTQDENARISITDIAGKVIFQQSIKVEIGRNIYTITALSGLPNGQYFAKIKASGSQYNTIIIKS